MNGIVSNTLIKREHTARRIQLTVKYTGRSNQLMMGLGKISSFLTDRDNNIDSVEKKLRKIPSILTQVTSIFNLTIHQ